jgi:hypothetical protein
VPVAGSVSLLDMGEGSSTVWSAFPIMSTRELEQNASHHPVLKHGPRSLTCARVLGV